MSLLRGNLTRFLHTKVAEQQQHNNKNVAMAESGLVLEADGKENKMEEESDAVAEVAEKENAIETEPTGSRGKEKTDENWDDVTIAKPSKERMRKKNIRNSILLILKIVSAIIMIWDLHTAWMIFHYFISDNAGLSKDSVRPRVVAAWGFFSSFAVLMAVLTLWDMLVESLKDFRVAKVKNMKLIHVKPHHELFIVATMIQLPQSTILLTVLVNYSVVGIRAPAFIMASAYEVFLDWFSMIMRYASALNKLYKIMRRGTFGGEPRVADVVVIVIDWLAFLLLGALAIAFNVMKKKRGY